MDIVEKANEISDRIKKVISTVAKEFYKDEVNSREGMDALVLGMADAFAVQIVAQEDIIGEPFFKCSQKVLMQCYESRKLYEGKIVSCGSMLDYLKESK